MLSAARLGVAVRSHGARGWSCFAVRKSFPLDALRVVSACLAFFFLLQEPGGSLLRIAAQNEQIQATKRLHRCASV